MGPLLGMGPCLCIFTDNDKREQWRNTTIIMIDDNSYIIHEVWVRFVSMDPWAKSRLEGDIVYEVECRQH